MMNIKFNKVLCRNCRKKFLVHDLTSDNNISLFMKCCPFCGIEGTNLTGLGLKIYTKEIDEE